MSTYAIAIIRTAYTPDLQGIGRPRIIESDLTATQARSRMAELDAEPYCTSNGEAGAPEYILIEDHGYEVGQTIGCEDASEYDWDLIDCTHEDDDGNKCGECQSCILGMINQNKEAVRIWAEAIPEPAPQRYEFDEACMGCEWRGDLDSFAEVLQDLAGPQWSIIAVNDSYNGANNRNPETGDDIDFPESIWLAALDKHATAHPEMWAC